MIYEYVCDSKECIGYGVSVEINKTLADVARKETCTICNKPLRRVYTSPGVKTNDKYKL